MAGLGKVYKNGYNGGVKTFASVWDAIESGEVAESLKARARVMAEVQRVVRSWGLSQAAAAEKLGISQPRINDLLRGKIERFSLDTLFDLATHAGVELYRALGVREAPAAYGRRAGARRKRKSGVREVVAGTRRPRLFVIAGPNGAGKTTFAQEYLPREAGTIRFVNADLIAAGLSPLAPGLAALASGRLVLAELDRLTAAREDFAFESTLSGLAYVGRLERWRRDGYFIKIVFLKLDSPALALKRIAARVLQGGHDVPREDVLRRFARSLENFQSRYRPLADAWELYENSGQKARLLETGP